MPAISCTEGWTCSVGCALSVPRRVSGKEEEENLEGEEGRCRELVRGASCPGLTSRSETPGHTAGFQSFFTRSQELASLRRRTLAGRVRSFSTGRLRGASGAAGWASSWPALAARHSCIPARRTHQGRQGSHGKEQGPRAGRDAAPLG
jgi:hypothetical protein